MGNPSFSLLCNLGDYEIRNETGLGKALKASPDLILLDQEGLGSLNKREDTSGVPMVFISPKALNRSNTTKAFEVGCIDSIREDEKENILQNKLKVYVHLSKLNKEMRQLIEKIN